MKYFALTILAAFGLLLGSGQVKFSSAATISVPCGASVDAAYHSAQPGDTLQLGACTYGGQQLTYDSSKATATSRVVIQGQSGTTFAGLTVSGAQHFELRNVQVNGWIFATALNKDGGGPRFSDAVFDGVNSNIFFVRTGLNITYRNGQIGPSHDSSSPTVGTYSGLPPSENVVFDNVHFYNVDRDNNPTGHVECLFVQESDGTVIRNSRFEQCDVMDLYVNAILGGKVTNMLVQNTRFDAATPSGFYSSDSGAWPVRYEFNSFGQSIVAQGASGCGNTRDSTSVNIPALLLQPCSSPPPTTTSTTTPTTTTTTTTSSSTTSTTTPTVTVTTTLPQDTTTIYSTTTLSAVTTTVDSCAPDPGYATCQDEISDLKNQLAAANALAADLRSQLDAANSQIDVLQHQLDAANNTITQIKAWLAQVPALP